MLKRPKKLLPILLIALSIGLVACGGPKPATIDFDMLPKKKQVSSRQYLTSIQAYAMKKATIDGKADVKPVLFLDVRTRAELNFLGTPTVTDANIPFKVMSYIYNPAKKSYKLSVNPNFLFHVEDLLSKKGLPRDTAIILICRSGGRSATAANLLYSAGIKNVYTVVDGYEGDTAKAGPMRGMRVVNGWKNSGMPWTYRLKQEHIYTM
ncbi:MAG: sulfurtransferase [Magnetococcales bacterium]|nr:sulfurtransferase [Magnetococcales bacterium]